MSLVSFVPSAVGAVIPEDSGGPYVIAAYLVFLVLIAAYVAIMAQRLTKISKQAAELEQRIVHVQNAGAGAVQGDVHGPGHESASAPGGDAGSGDDREKVVS